MRLDRFLLISQLVNKRLEVSSIAHSGSSPASIPSHSSSSRRPRAARGFSSGRQEICRKDRSRTSNQT
jgi:hypothetical protein